MPVTIGTMASSLSIVEASGGAITEEMLERIVTLVLQRLKEERFAEKQVQQERQIRDRMSETEPF